MNTGTRESFVDAASRSFGWDEQFAAALELVPERCIAFNEVECGVCVRVCPIGEKAIALDNRGCPVIRVEGCVGCGVCVRACVTVPSSLSLHLDQRQER